MADYTKLKICFILATKSAQRQIARNHTGEISFQIMTHGAAHSKRHIGIRRIMDSP